MDNRYATPQLFSRILTNYSIRGLGTYKANRIGSNTVALKMKKTRDMGAYVRTFNKRVGMVITRLKYSKLLQTVSNVINSCIV